MSQPLHTDFSIQRLGEPRFLSPMRLSNVEGDSISNFIEDDKRILLDHCLHSVRQAFNSGEEPASFEAAGPREHVYFNPTETRAAIVTCGGLCPGMNDVIRGIVLTLFHNYGARQVLGVQYGYMGMVERSNLPLIPLDPDSVENIRSTAGTMLGSSRGPQSVHEMCDFLAKNRIDLLFTIGGDGTQRGALALTEEIQRRGLKIAVVGVPKTIDNDILYIDRSFGFDTAYSVAAGVINGAHAEAKGALNGVCIVKVMGRHSGFLAAAAAVASGEANFCLVPEAPFDLEPPNGFLAALERRILKRKHAVVVVAEGAGQEHLQTNRRRDASGNLVLGDIGTLLHQRSAEYLRDRGIPASVRYIDPSYIVRSQEAIHTDRQFCIRLAHNAVHAAMSGRTGMVVGYWKSMFTHAPIQAAVSHRKVLDTEGDLWLAVLETTDQPTNLLNRRRETKMDSFSG